MKIVKYGLLLCGIYLFNGCTGQPYIPQVEEIEVNKYEKAYMAEYETIRQQNTNYQPSFKWIQPKNKKDECMIWVGYNPVDDRTIKNGYTLYWDGECTDGYADGLGSVFEISQFADRQQIATYSKGNPDTYCVNLDPLNGITKEGECLYYTDKPSHYVKTTVADKQGDLNIAYEFGVEMSKISPMIIMRSWLFYDVVEYYKIYPNFSYAIADLTKNEFDNRNYEFNLKEHKNGKYNGYSFATMKQGFTDSGEMVNGTLSRRVQLPQSYFDKANLILNEIKNEANIALDAQRKALVIKEKYKKKICKNDVQVDFMDNDEYKTICKEDEKFANLKVKIDKKLAEINTIKNQKRDQKRKDEIANAEQKRIQQNIDAQNTMQNIQMLNQTIQLYKAFR